MLKLLFNVRWRSTGAALFALTATYSGFVNGDSASSPSMTSSLATAATEASPVVSGG